MNDTISSTTGRFLQEADTARALCRRHAAPLLAMASAMIDDVERASDIVASAIAAVCRDHRGASSTDDVILARLSRSVYRRCLGHLALMERFPQLDRRLDRRPATRPTG